MNFFNFFRNDKKPPKAVERVFEKMKVEMKGQEISDKAISYRNLGEYDKALTLLKDAIEKYNYMPALTLIGTTSLIKGDIDNAIEWFAKIIKTPPKGAEYLLGEWYANLGVIYLYKKNDCITASEMLEKALNFTESSSMSQAECESALSLIYRDMAVGFLLCGEIYYANMYARKRLTFNPGCDSSKKVVTECINQSRNKVYTPNLSLRPPCHTVAFSPDGKSTPLMAKNAKFPSPANYFIHGMAHTILHMLYDVTIKATPEYSEKVWQNILTIEKVLGVKDSKWTVEQEENFARQYELYMASNKPELKLSFYPGEHFDKRLSSIFGEISNK